MGNFTHAWQYTTCDVASSYTWAELHVTPQNPSAQWTSGLARRVAHELCQRSWQLAAGPSGFLATCRSSAVPPGAAEFRE